MGAGAVLVTSFDGVALVDFANLWVTEVGDADAGIDAGRLGLGWAGSLAMRTGPKYGDVPIRIELWDECPQDPRDDWEEADETPFRTVSSGRLRLFEGDADALDVGIGRFRARILVSGRAAAAALELAWDGDSGAEPESPERWLVQIWPSTDVDPLAGPPRKLLPPWRGYGSHAPEAPVHDEVYHALRWSPHVLAEDQTDLWPGWVREISQLQASVDQLARRWAVRQQAVRAALAPHPQESLATQPPVAAAADDDVLTITQSFRRRSDDPKDGWG